METTNAASQSTQGVRDLVAQLGLPARDSDIAELEALREGTVSLVELIHTPEARRLLSA